MATINSRAVIGPSATVIANVWGTVASPIATISGSTGTLFTLPADIVIPANIIPDYGRLWVEARVKRTGANATAQLDAYLGTAKTSSDSLLGRVQATATDGHLVWLFSPALFNTSASNFFAGGTSAPQASTGGGTAVDRSTNINRQAVMYVTLGMSSANALDAFALIGYRVWLE